MYFLHHLLFPRHSNNHRSKVLHHEFLLLFIGVFIFAGLIFRSVKSTLPAVLGDAINISIDQLVALTNQKRQELGLRPLTFNATLSQAADSKAHDMFTKNYWAHNGPDGTNPWFFFKQLGYDYLYAGENLARGFNSADEVVKAWMASPTHRENMLSPNYTEIGFAIQQGKLTGEDTTLVVEMLGAKYIHPVAKKEIMPTPSEKVVVAEAKATSSSIAVNTSPPTSKIAVSLPNVSLNSNPLIEHRSISWDISTVFLFFFIMILALDMIIVERKKIVRLVGHNADHMFFLGGILIFVLVITKGFIL